MSKLTPEILLSEESRKRCLIKFNKIPPLIYGKRPTKTAAVLVPLCLVKASICLLYTQRSSNLKSHSGDISFPGGKTDEGESAVETALREAEEEIGLPRSQVELWGAGPSCPGRDNSILVTPVIGYINKFNIYDLRPSVQEVEDVFTVPLQDLCNPNNQGRTQFNNGFTLPTFTFEKHKIWGLTAFITHAFLSSLLPRSVYKNNFLNSKDVTKVTL